MLFNVQVLRALAAGLVMLVHLEVLTSAAGWPTQPALFGHSGVDVFFVLSGFLMAHTTATKPVAAASFFLNRLIRVVPLYWLCTLAVSIIGLVRPTFLATTKISASTVAKSLLFVPFAKPNGLVEPVLFLGWTLNYEMLFYVLFALAILSSGGRRVAVATCVIIGLVATGALFSPVSVPARFYTNPIMLEFVLGMMLAGLLGQGRALARGTAWAVVIGGLAVLIGRFWVFPLGERAWWSGIPAALVLAGLVSLERRGVVLRARAAQLLGASSYAFYLIHPFIAQAAIMTVLTLAGTRPSLLNASIILIYVLTAAMAVALHLLVERPITAGLRRKVRHQPSTIEDEERGIGEAIATVTGESRPSLPSEHDRGECGQ